MHTHTDQNELIISILSQISYERNKSLEKMKRLLLIKQNKSVNRQFWKILDDMLPDHQYSYVGCCGECGSLELRKALPPTNN